MKRADKCHECLIPHPWSAHLPGRGCMVPGCCCQSDKQMHEKESDGNHK